MNPSSIMEAMNRTDDAAVATRMIFVRHGITEPNRSHLRCGGDLDVPMLDAGRAQIEALGIELTRSKARIDVIACSNLLRTIESARILAKHVNAASTAQVPLIIEPLLRERSLGTWNMQPIEHTEAALQAGETPPGGESEEAFTRRVTTAMVSLQRRHARQSLLIVGSKGVARIMRKLYATHDQETAATHEWPPTFAHQPLGNAQWLHFVVHS